MLQATTSATRRRRLVWLAALGGLHTTVSVYAATRWGVALSALSLGVVVPAAWWFGRWGGAAAAVCVAPLHIGVQVLVRNGFPHSEFAAIPYWVTVASNLATVAVGAVVGLLAERLRGMLHFREECEQRYERAARGANDGLWEWDLHNDLAYFSERWCALLGYERDEIKPHVSEWLDRVHEDDLPTLRSAIDQHVSGRTARFENEHRVRARDGRWVWLLCRGTHSTTDTGTSLVTGWTSDITERKHTEDQLRFHAFHDPLTGLCNRSLFLERLRHAIARAAEHPDQRLVVGLLDLDRFKRVNDSLGHAAGDALLKTVAERLNSAVRASDTVARLGGDEFALLAEDVGSDEGVAGVAERVRSALRDPVAIRGQAVPVGASIGIAVGDGEQQDPAELLRDADTAMYRAKRQGRGSWVRFDPSMHDQAVQRLELENELRGALATGELHVLYQPIVSMKGQVVGFEALPRWHHPRLGLLLPGDFIPIAEETGLIMELGDLVMSEACDMVNSLLPRFRQASSWMIGVNVSPRQVRNPELATRVDAILSAAEVRPDRLLLEVTEDLILEDVPAGGHLFGPLRSQGVRTCMDDFGTGYSSLSYLHRFRVDYLKVETAFVHGMDRPGGVQIVRSLINLALNLGIKTIAEGVETRAQRDRLRELGCPFAQGHFIAPPLARDELSAWLSEKVAV